VALVADPALLERVVKGVSGLAILVDEVAGQGDMRESFRDEAGTTTNEHACRAVAISGFLRAAGTGEPAVRRVLEGVRA
jgi:hypothetical protein